MFVLISYCVLFVENGYPSENLTSVEVFEVSAVEKEELVHRPESEGVSNVTTVVISTVLPFVILIMGLWLYRSAKKKTKIIDSSSSVDSASKMNTTKVYPGVLGEVCEIQASPKMNGNKISPDGRDGKIETPTKMDAKKVYPDDRSESIKIQMNR